MPTPSRRSSLLLPFLAAVLTACGGSEPGREASASPIRAPTLHPGAAGGNELVTVMSWNLYLGAELGPLLQAKDEPALLAATTAAWAMVVKNDFRVRAAAVADQIAVSRPELIGLQEAYTWRMGAADGELRVVYDYVQILLEELTARGLRYRVAATATLTDVVAPILTSLDPPALAFVEGTDHEVILAREDVHTANPGAHVFPAEHLLDVPGRELKIKRGWASVDVKRAHQGVSFRFVSTHLEAYDPLLRARQAQDLAAALGRETHRPGLSRETPPIVLVGDLNSDPLDDTVSNRDAYLALAGAGFDDAWLSLHPDEPGFTSPYPEDLTIPEISFDERIDSVLFRGALAPQAMAVVGMDPSERACGVSLAEREVCLWPSDHAGLWATLRLETPRFLALTR